MKANLSAGILLFSLLQIGPAFSLDDPRLAIGRSLSSNCTQCHSTNGQPRDKGNASLVCTNTGTNTAASLKKRIIDLRNKNPYSDLQKQLMILHAKSYASPSSTSATGFSYWGGGYYDSKTKTSYTYLDGDKTRSGATVTWVDFSIDEIDAIAYYLCLP